MNILVFSDSHGHISVMQKILTEKSNTNVVFFLGDGVQEVETLSLSFPKIQFFSVVGNCDSNSCLPLENIVNSQNKYIYYTHGHNYNVKTDVDTLYIIGKKIGSDIILFGHTHIPYYELREGIHILNPGSISYPRNGFASYGAISINNSEILCSIIPVDPSIPKTEIEKYTHSFLGTSK